MSSESTSFGAFKLRLAEGLAGPDKRWKPLRHQVPPDFDAQDWQYWLLIGGRGIGKTDAGAAALDAYMQRHPGTRGRIIAPTLGDAREACVIGPSGIRAHNPSVHFNTTEGALIWPNGSRAKIYGASKPEDVERLRAGGNAAIDWFEEFAAWAKLEECWDQARFGLRLGSAPKTIITTTPKPKDRLRWLLGYPIQRMGPNPQTVVSRAVTGENPHLPASVRADLEFRYKDTRIGRQELLGEMLDDVPGALWSREMLDAVRVYDLPDMVRVVIGVDPAATSGDKADETGIVVVGLGVDGHGYVFADRTCRLPPQQWASRVVSAYYEFQGDRIVPEVNNGGEMVALTLRTIDPDLPIRPVHASHGKRTRAEPIAAMYEQGRIHHCGDELLELEDQMCQFLPENPNSPDRVDALVWALTDLMLGGHVQSAFPQLATLERRLG